MRITTLITLLFSITSPLNAQQAVCVDGNAGGYPCALVDLLAFLPITEMGGDRNTEANDIWGWTDPISGKEYALVGLTTGTAFVDITKADQPVYLGSLPTHTSSSIWRDIKVYDHHAFIVSEASGHGMQVFDLSQLTSVAKPPVTFSSTAHFDGFGRAHNIVINEDSGFAFVVGGSSCAGGLYMIDISTPAKPAFAGCYSDDGYTHDAQCVIYAGPDPDYKGKEICVNANEDTITVVDVTSKTTPAEIARVGYPGSEYIHQGWFSEDQRYFYQNDELDEDGTNTRTIIWDLKELGDPVVADEYFGPTKAIDHNLYVKENLIYESNYTAGLRILDVSDPLSPREVAYFDTYPASNAASFNGAWSSYPYFKSGNVIINSIEDGLFIVKPDLGALPVDLVTFVALANGDEVMLQWQTASETNNAGFDIEQLVSDAFVKIGYVEGQGTSEQAQNYTFTLANPGPGQLTFRLKQIDFDGSFTYSETATVTLASSADLLISEAYPNPFNPVTLISVSVVRTQTVKVEVYNYQGQRVGLLFDGTLDANLGKELRFDAGDLPSGAYLIRATGEHEVATQSVTLVK